MKLASNFTSPSTGLIGALIAAVLLAAPAQADPDANLIAGPVNAPISDGAKFLGALDAVGITYTNPTQAVAAGQAVCGLVAKGEPGLKVVMDIKNNNPGFNTDGATTFAALAAQSFCPHQLTKK